MDTAASASASASGGSLAPLCGWLLFSGVALLHRALGLQRRAAALDTAYWAERRGRTRVEREVGIIDSIA
jgi:hypothetical protein